MLSESGHNSPAGEQMVERERERWDAESPTVRMTHIHRQADIFDSCTDTPERHTDPLCPGEVLIGVTSLTSLASESDHHHSRGVYQHVEERV